MKKTITIEEDEIIAEINLEGLGYDFEGDYFDKEGYEKHCEKALIEEIKENISFGDPTVKILIIRQ